MGYEFFGEKIIFPSAPVPGINNDQSLTDFTLGVFVLVNTVFEITNSKSCLWPPIARS